MDGMAYFTAAAGEKDDRQGIFPDKEDACSRMQNSFYVSHFPYDACQRGAGASQESFCPGKASGYRVPGPQAVFIDRVGWSVELCHIFVMSLYSYVSSLGGLVCGMVVSCGQSFSWWCAVYGPF